jgi:hypothetical protein
MIQVRAEVWQLGKDRPGNARIAITTPDGTRCRQSSTSSNLNSSVKGDKILINGVISMGRRNTQATPIYVEIKGQISRLNSQNTTLAGL